MEQELAYSFHLGSDKNKSKLAKKVAKENLSGTTSLSNNSIQNAEEGILNWNPLLIRKFEYLLDNEIESVFNQFQKMRHHR